MYSDRRCSQRISAKVVASCIRDHNTFESKQHFLSFTRDISLQGGRFVLAQKVDKDDMFTVGLSLPTCFLPLSVYSQVVWVKQIVVTGKEVFNLTEAGIKFLKMDAVDTNKLIHFLDDKSPSSIFENELKAFR